MICRVSKVFSSIVFAAMFGGAAFGGMLLTGCGTGDENATNRKGANEQPNANNNDGVSHEACNSDEICDVSANDENCNGLRNESCTCSLNDDPFECTYPNPDDPSKTCKGLQYCETVGEFETWSGVCTPIAGGCDDDGDDDGDGDGSGGSGGDGDEGGGGDEGGDDDTIPAECQDADGNLACENEGCASIDACQSICDDIDEGAEACTQDIDIVMVLDRSGSMQDPLKGESESKLDGLKAAAISMLDYLEANGGIGDGQRHRVGVVGFPATEVGRYGCRMVSNAVVGQIGLNDTSTTHTSLVDSIGGICSLGGTPLRSAMGVAESDMRSHRRTGDVKSITVVLSDGKPTGGIIINTEMPRAGDIADLQSVSEVYTIALGTNSSYWGGDFDPGLMRRISSDPEHNAFEINTSVGLKETFLNIASAACEAPSWCE